MTSTFTSNINLEEPARGDDVGTWDTPVNANMTLLDLVSGGVSTISLNNSPVVLSAAQFKSAVLVFNSTLTGSVAITFPTSFIKPYTIRNACTGSSAFIITMVTTASATQTICAPPGESVSVYSDGTSLNYMGLGRVGTYMDFAGSSVPAWVSGCTVAPYLNCNSTTFSATTYPALAALLGGTTTPDSRGRYRATLDQSAGRLSSAVTGFSPDTVAAGGSSQTKTLVTANLPAYTPSGTITVTAPAVSIMIAGAGGAGPSFSQNPAAAALSPQNADTATFAGVAQGGTSSGFSIIPPTYMGGITMIRAG